jgi:hypothetical protein
MKSVSAVASVGLLVAGTAAAVALPNVTSVGLGAEKTVTSGLVDPDNPSGAATFMQFPFAESFPSPSGGR